MKIVLSYIHYPMAIGKFFDAALRRRADVELFTVGPYSGAWIPWGGGMNLPTRYAIPPTIPLPLNGTLPPVPIQFIERQLPWQPDLWLHIDAGWHLRGKPAHGKNVIVGTDPHVLDYDGARQFADTFYCMQDCYKKPGDVYLPYAYDPHWHKPEPQPRNYDACLLGLHYENRDRLVGELRKKGVNVCYDLGPSFDEARALYNQAPIALSWSSRDDLIARVFEGMAMGRLVVTNRVPDLPLFFKEDLFEGDEPDLVVFNSLGEAVEKITWYLEHPEQAQIIASRGREAVEPHSWDDRIEQILGGL